KRLTVDRLPHHDLRATSREARVIVESPQRAVQTRRRNFEGVAGRYHILDVENRAQIATDMRAVLDADALFGRRRRPRSIDLDPQDHPRAFAPVLHIEDLEAITGRNARGDATNLFFDSPHRPHKLKKWAHAHSVLQPRLRTWNYSTSATGLAMKS